MPILVWSDEYCINVAEIDAQHKKLLEYVNKLHAGVEAQIDKKELRRLVLELVDYTRFHFATEEKLMEEHAMEGVANHQNDHESLLRHLVGIVDAISEQKRPAFYSQYDVSNDWFLAHILGFDKNMGAFLNSKGVY
jgi:hemerythrin